MSVWSDLIGTTRAFFRIGTGGPRLKNTAGALQVRNSGDTADVAVTASTLNASGDSVVINSDAAGSGNDFSLTLQRNLSATANLTVVTPPAKGTDGYLLRQKAGTAAGVLELELVAPTSTSSQLTSETTTLNFGSTSPVSMFTLSATGVIDRIQVIVDTAFNGTPSASVGIAGSTSKYVSATDLDLTQPAQTVFEIHPGQPAPGTPENLIITFAANGATAGSARFLVYYADSPV